MSPRRKDLSAADFKAQLKLHGFAHLKAEGKFADTKVRVPAAGAPGEIFHRIAPVMAGKNRIHRKATLAALLKARAGRLAEANAEAERLAAIERKAAAIVPQVFAPARDTLDGEAAIAALADDFIVITTRAEGACIPDLMRLGWRKAQIFEYADAARSLAAARQGGLSA